MPKSVSPNLQDAAILTHAVENVFRKLIRILVGRISLLKLQEMINFIYVQEAEKKLKKDHPGKNVPLTRLALMTGLDSRNVVSIKVKIEKSGEKYSQIFLKELTPESAIVEQWINQVENASGKEKAKAEVLSYGADDADFEKLFRATISARGITSRSIIQRLVASRSVEHDKKNKTVKIIVKKFSPYLSDDEPQIFNAAFTAISNLISTVENNLAAPGKDRLFQRQVWTFRLAPADKIKFRQEIRKFLEAAEQKAREEMEPWEAEFQDKTLMSAGIGLYYFEEIGQVSDPEPGQ